jgi:hypothetical protein
MYLSGRLKLCPDDLRSEVFRWAIGCRHKLEVSLGRYWGQLVNGRLWLFEIQ